MSKELSLEEQGEILFNGKSLDEITLDDVEEFKEAYYEGDPKITDELHRKYFDVETAYKAALDGQEKVFTLHRNILERLEKY